MVDFDLELKAQSPVPQYFPTARQKFRCVARAKKVGCGWCVSGGVRAAGFDTPVRRPLATGVPHHTLKPAFYRLADDVSARSAAGILAFASCKGALGKPSPHLTEACCETCSSKPDRIRQNTHPWPTCVWSPTTQNLQNPAGRPASTSNTDSHINSHGASREGQSRHLPAAVTVQNHDLGSRTRHSFLMIAIAFQLKDSWRWT